MAYAKRFLGLDRANEFGFNINVSNIGMASMMENVSAKWPAHHYETIIWMKLSWILRTKEVIMKYSVSFIFIDMEFGRNILC